MRINNIFYSSHFEKAFKFLPLNVKKQAQIRVEMFRDDCFSKSLRTHKLKGKLEKYWAFSINRSYRILFEFIGKNDVGFIDIGTHSIYR